MKLTKLSAAPGASTKAPPHARAGRHEHGIAAQLVPGVGPARRTWLSAARMRASSLVLLLGVAARVRAGCVDWKAMGEFADLAAASVVFEGVVLRIEPGDVTSCSPERVVFRVERQWKGEPAAEVTLLQENDGRRTEPGPEGGSSSRGCPVWSESDRFKAAGARFIVFAVGPGDQLKAMGCGTSKSPTKPERRRLDKWKRLDARTARYASPWAPPVPGERNSGAMVRPAANGSVRPGARS